MEDQKYEWFIRRAYNSTKNASIGADVYYWRNLGQANAVFVQSGAQDPSEALTDYNNKENQIRQFIIQALGKYREHQDLNTAQKEKLNTLQQELNIRSRQQKGFGIVYLNAMMQQADMVMESDLAYTVTAIGVFDQESYLRPAKEEVHKCRNFFGTLKQLTLNITQTPFGQPEGSAVTKIEFSEDLKECRAEIHFNPQYNKQGEVIEVVQPFEFRSRITEFLGKIQSGLPQVR